MRSLFRITCLIVASAAMTNVRRIQRYLLRTRPNPPERQEYCRKMRRSLVPVLEAHFFVAFLAAVRVSCQPLATPRLRFSSKAQLLSGESEWIWAIRSAKVQWDANRMDIVSDKRTGLAFGDRLSDKSHSYRVLMIVPANFFADYSGHARFLDESHLPQKLGHWITIAASHSGGSVSGSDVHRTLPVPLVVSLCGQIKLAHVALDRHMACGRYVRCYARNPLSRQSIDLRDPATR